MTPTVRHEAADENGILVMAELPVAYTQYLLPFKDFLRSELTESCSNTTTIHRFPALEMQTFIRLGKIPASDRLLSNEA